MEQAGYAMIKVDTNMMVAAAVAAQWVVVALISVIAPLKMRKVLAVSTAVFAAGWLFAFDAKSMVVSKNDTTQASTAAGETKTHQGTCALIQNGMTLSQVTSKLGQPDETRADDIVRGPGSTTLVYRDMRCAVHVFEDKVDLVE